MKFEKITPAIAALYLGQKCDIEWLFTDTIDDAFKSGDVWSNSKIHGAHIVRLEREEIGITPYLRSLESLTEAEAKEIYELFYKKEFPDNYQKRAVGFFVARFNNEEYPPTVFLYLLRKGFDLFQLIQNNLAKAVK